MGWSTGGSARPNWCSDHPTISPNAAALGAYFEPITDDTTGDLFDSNQDSQNENSPLYLYQHGGLAPGHNLLLVSSQAWQSLRRGGALDLFDMSNNLGDAKSLVTHPATAAHERIRPERRAAMELGDEVIRLSIGLEDPRDLVADLDRALG